jgi:hypothetical protein
VLPEGAQFGLLGLAYHVMATFRKYAVHMHMALDEEKGRN